MQGSATCTDWPLPFTSRQHGLVSQKLLTSCPADLSAHVVYWPKVSWMPCAYSCEAAAHIDHHDLPACRIQLSAQTDLCRYLQTTWAG